jgi:hypothetical protein
MFNCEWDGNDVCFVLDQQAWVDFFSASSLKQQFADRHVVPLGHIILILSQPVFAINMLASGVVSRGFEPWSGQAKDY